MNQDLQQDFGWKLAYNEVRTTSGLPFDLNRKPRDRISKGKDFFWVLWSDKRRLLRTLPPSNLLPIPLPWVHRYIVGPIKKGVRWSINLESMIWCTDITEHVSINPYKFAKLPVAFVYLACSSPKTRWYTHCGKDTIIIKKHAFERFLNKHEVLKWIVCNVDEGWSGVGRQYQVA